MRILERYISKSILQSFLATIFIFCFLYIMIDITMNLDELLDRKVPVSTLIQYYLLLLPIIFVQTSPIGCLIAVLITFSSLNNTNQIIPMRSSGMNFWQITKPALIFGLVVSVCIFWINERFVPMATETTKKIKTQELLTKEKSERHLKAKIKNLTFYGLKNRLYFIDMYHPNTYDLEGITIIENDNEQNIRKKIDALHGKWTGIAWKFYNCRITTFDYSDGNTSMKVKNYAEKLMDIKETPEDFLKQRLNVDAMNIQQLKEYIGRFSNSGAIRAINNLQVDLHQKWAFPFGNFVIVLLGLPFALMVKSRRRSTFATLFIALIIGFLYFVARKDWRMDLLIYRSKIRICN